MTIRIHGVIASFCVATFLHGQSGDIIRYDFENALSDWEIHKSDGGKSRAVPEAVHTGKLGLLVTDPDETGGGEIHSAPVPAKPGKTYRVRFQARGIEGKGLGVYLLFTDESGKWLNDSRQGNEIVVTVPEGPGDWKQHAIAGKAPDSATHLRVRVHSYGKAVVTACVDDIEVTELSPEEAVVALGGPVASRAAIDRTVSMLASAPIVFGARITDRQAWDAFGKRAPNLIAEADALLAKPIPEITDNLFLLFKTRGTRVEYERPNHARRVRIRLLTLAECVTNSGKYLPAIEETLRAILAEKTWVLPAHDATLENLEGKIVNIDLEAAVRGATIATAISWLGDRLDPQLRARAVAELDRRVVQPYLAKIRSGPLGKLCWWTHAPTNWNAVCHSQVLMVALSTVPDIRTRAEIVAGARVYSSRYYDGFTPDGYCSEGLGYWGYGFGHYVLLAEAMLRATNGELDFYKPDVVRAVARFPERLRMAGNVYPSFADCPRYPGPTPWITDIIDARLNNKIHDREHLLTASAINGPLQGTLPEIAIFSFPLPTPDNGSLTVASARNTTNNDAAPALNNAQRGWFPQAGILVCRSGTDDPSYLEVAIKGGHNAENHNHNDVGGFVLALNGRSPVIDPGLDVYTANDTYETTELKSSIGHSVPLVAGQTQRPGRIAAAKILRTGFSPEQDVYSLDLTALYNVPQLVRLTRTFTCSRQGKGSLTIIDEVEFSIPRTYETALITFGEITPCAQSAASGRSTATAISITDGPASIMAEFVATTPGNGILKTSVRPLKTRFENPPKRLAVSLDQPVSRVTLALKITPQTTP
ncbi:MAG: heparinase II/III family protein [Opitutaceae bacterium]|jgi:hypothetical protein|nr:heparinase II/III family protein [Opitutaceae bacterium]